MSRLTKKDNRKDVIIPYSPIADNLLIINKLGQLENLLEKYGIPSLKYLEKCIIDHDKYGELGEQIGCPLEVVITPYFKRGKLEVFYRGKMREVIRVVAFEEATRPYMDVFYRDNEKEQFKVRTIWLDDYKKTWWLREDRSE